MSAESEPSEKKLKPDLNSQFDSVASNENYIEYSNVVIAAGAKRKTNKKMSKDEYERLIQMKVMELVAFGEKSDENEEIAGEIFAQLHREMDMRLLVDPQSGNLYFFVIYTLFLLHRNFIAIHSLSVGTFSLENAGRMLKLFGRFIYEMNARINLVEVSTQKGS